MGFFILLLVNNYFPIDKNFIHVSTPEETWDNLNLIVEAVVCLSIYFIITVFDDSCNIPTEQNP